jgi:hypothetical protein
MASPRVLSAALALTGLLLFVGPLALFGFVALPANPGWTYTMAMEFLVAWAFVSTVGFALLIVGIASLGRTTVRGLRPSRLERRAGLRAAVTAGVVLLLGFSMLVATVVFVNSCRPDCPYGGGSVGPRSGSAATCSGICSVSLGSLELWPIDLIVLAILLEIASGVLATVAFTQAISASRAG